MWCESMAEPFSTSCSSRIRTAKEAARILIVGLGNPMMADDGIGHEVIRRLGRRALPAGARLLAIDGDVLALVDLWQGEGSVWLVDAVRSDRPAGTLQAFEHEELLRLPASGQWTHHSDLAEGLRWIIHTRPEMAEIRFRLYGIEAAVVRPGQRRSRAVERSIDRLVTRIGNAARPTLLT
jgi:hydrogenase maturation protease